MPGEKITKGDFLKAQLKKLGIKDDIAKLKDLTVPEGETHVISSQDPRAKGVKWLKDAGYKLKPKTIVDVKKWIGVPDTISRQLNRPQIQPVSRIISSDVLDKSKASRHLVKGAAITNARAYITGDSAKLSAADISAIDATLHIPNIERLFPVFSDVVIEHNANLVLAQDVNSLTCGNLIIKTGGKLTCKAGYTAIWAHSAKGKQP